MSVTPYENRSDKNRSLPDLTTRLGPKLTLANPVLAASGTFGEELAGLTDLASPGAMTTSTVTRLPRAGNPMPRTAEASAGLLHATGLPNPGLNSFIEERLPTLCALGCPIIVSILGTQEAEWKELAEGLNAQPGVVALELNLTPLLLLTSEQAHNPLPCAMRDHPEAGLHEQIRMAVSTVRAVTSLPIIAKLPASGIEIGAAAQTAESAGADIIAAAQAFPGLAVQLSQRRLRFAGGVGGLSGPCIKPLALYQVWRIAQCVSLPIVGGGGIMTSEDALEFFITGADAVAIGIANTIHATAVTRIASELRAWLAQHKLPDVQALHSRKGRTTTPQLRLSPPSKGEDKNESPPPPPSDT